MSLEIGIVGLPNVGKSTLFNALTNAGAAVASYPFTTIDPNIGVVPLADPRLDFVASLVKPQNVVPSTVRFVDIAGLVRGAHRGEGLGNQFLGHIRNVDAIAMVARCFKDENVAHVQERIDPVADIETVWTELILADVEIVERRIERIQGAAKANPKAFADELDWLARLRNGLNGGQRASALLASDKERAWAAEMALLTNKPYLYAINVDEADLPDGGAQAERVKALVIQEGVEVVVLCAQTEMELQEWPADDAATYLADLGLSESGLQRLVHAGYRALDLITFFTATGTKTVQAWAIPAGTTAPRAAGKIHTDFERGFIRAEVVSFVDLHEMGSFAEARHHGRLRTEGREYVVQDGDVIHFLFNV
ncbi:MAG: redox-regulated ATPase YchF [Anaerolineae bacterium]|nr:redox-regulated ATPase YchF [Anaerolineae bacterium]